MKKKYTYRIWMMLLITVALAGCRSTRKVTADGDDTLPSATTPADATVVTRMNTMRRSETAFTSKVNVTLVMGDKDVSVGGTLRMKRDESIQLSLVMLGLMEVGRLELTPDYFMLVDRMNHRYVKRPYADVRFFVDAGVDFFTFQALFWNELFCLGKDKRIPESSDFIATSLNDELLLTQKKSGKVSLSFVVKDTDLQLTHTRIGGTDEAADKGLTWKYASFEPFGDTPFPRQMQLSAQVSQKPLQATFVLGTPKVSADWETRTKLSNKYTEITVESIMNILMNLSK